MKTLCVDLGGSRVKLALMTAGSHPQPDVFEVDSRAPLAQTLSLVAQHAAAWGQPDAVSIALPCVVCRGTVIACNGKYTDAVGFDWVRWSQKTFGAPVFLMNDAAAALLGEMRCGAAKDTGAAAILMIGTGIGSAAAQDRRILTGRHGTMGMLAVTWRLKCCTPAAAPAARRAVWKHGRELGHWMKLPVRRMGLRKVPWRMRER